MATNVSLRDSIILGMQKVSEAIETQGWVNVNDEVNDILSDIDTNVWSLVDLIAEGPESV